MALDVKSVWSGALTDTSVRVIADTAPPTNGSLLVADNEAMTGAVTIGPVTATGEGILAFTVTGLDADTRYWYVVDAGGLNVSYKGTFRTHPGPVGEPASYIFGAAGDAGLTGAGDASHITNAVSNNPVFDTMRIQGRAEEWAWFSHLGDLHYRNIAANTPALYRAAYDDNFNYNLGFNPAARQGMFLREFGVTYVWDDHDFGPNNSDRTAAGRPAAQQVYRECVPHYPLPDAAGIHQSWQVGRVLYIASDVRSFRDPNSDAQSPTKTMLGSAQKAWMENLLSTTSAEALVWQTPSRWLADGAGTDTWNSFLHERAEMIQMFGDTGWLDRMIQLTADMHSLSMCSGPGNPHGGFPIYMLAGMDSDFGTVDTLYDIGSTPERRQYGTVRVTDSGHTIALAVTGYRDYTPLLSHTAYLDIGSPLIALNYNAGHISPPFEPTPDDEGVTNDVTATRQDGGQARFVKTEGLLNTNDPAVDPDGVGEYDGGGVTINVADDDQLPDQAAWRVHQGTVDEERYPLVHIDLAANPDLADEMTGLGLGDRITVANPPEWIPPDTIELIAEGGVETIGLYDWDMELNASAGSPWLVATAAAVEDSTAGPDKPNRGDTSGSELVTAVNDTVTSLIVHTPPDGNFERAPWIISTGPAAAPNLHPTHFPFDLRIGGEIVRATACEPGAWDSFTRSTSNGWGTANSGQAWTASGGAAGDYFTQGSEAGHTLTNVNASRWSTIPAPGPDLDFRADIATFATAVGNSQYVHLTARWLDVNNSYLARLAFTASQQVQLTLQKRVAGVQTDLSTVTLPGMHGAFAFWTIRFQLEGSTLRAKAWPRALAEPGRWHVTATDSVLTAAGSVGVRSILDNANTNPLPVTVAIDNFEVTTPQKVTVQREINTVDKAHAADTPIALAQPSPLAL
ncbi:alkaline phosphatase D family protein [Streptomyces phaeochromogenes]|uniref:alkaline phosphatase D family protein n=1 Tax=Streptomyces phaeochromogenes TaxID=1923 RepID=UPI002DDA93DB|nr:alkaline phosphatase D family protein [Streptomyces phaeochromogenes]WRZ31332.1 alkaline phosphatase D family protein [Streptomyces phaeochromogenes]